MRKEVWIAAAAVMLSGFAGVALADAAPADAGSAATFDVDLANVQFSPREVKVKIGDTVKFTNKDSMAHDVTFEDGVKSGEPGTFNPGAVWNRTFTAAGTFKFRCVVHSTNFDSGMTGKVIVEDPNAPAPKTPGFEAVALFAALALASVMFAIVARRRRK